MTIKSIPNFKNKHKICSVENCETKVYSKGFCIKHYKRFQAHGSPFIVKTNWGNGATPEERFWSRVALTANPDKCWYWQGLCLKGGYGATHFKGKNRTTHKIVWFLTHGYFPTKHLLHSCHHPSCVNPSHLREGTHQENMADMQKAGHQVRGETCGTSKLTEKEVLEIREKYQRKISVKQISKEYGISEMTVYMIKNRKTWTHI